MDKKKLRFTWKNVLLYSESAPGFIGLLIVIIVSFLYPYIQNEYEIGRYVLQTRKEALVKFTESITQQLNFFITSNEFVCKAENEKNKQIRQYYINQSNEFYSKMLSSSLPYETSCGILKVYFAGKEEREEIEKFEKTVADFLHKDNVYDKFKEKNKCEVSESFTNRETIVFDNYKILLIKLNKLIEKEL